MCFAGIISEYNPFHNGHLYQIKQAVKLCSAPIVVAMSGNFVQRGEPACIDKFTRAKLAVENGVAIVIEIPTFFAINNAENFALGGVKTLSTLSGFSTLIFGSECGDIEALKSAQALLADETVEFKNHLKTFLKQGDGFPTAREKALTLCGNTQVLDIISKPNNILAIEYIKALKKIDSSAQPLTIKRIGENFNSAELVQNCSSATAIRKALLEGNFNEISNNVPPSVFSCLKDVACDENEKLYPILKHHLLSQKTCNLSDCYGISEGLEYRIKEQFLKSFSYTEFMSNISTKRYTQSRLTRLILAALLGVLKKDDAFCKTQLPYINVLAINRKYISLLGKFNVPIVTKPSEKKRLLESNYNNTLLSRYAEIEDNAASVYSCLQRQKTHSSMIIV